MNIGITGHQKLPEGLILNWIDSELGKDINDFKNINHSFSSLAVGADQLFAKKILQLNLDLVGIIPSLQYENTFDEIHLASYFDLLSKCKFVETLDFTKPSEEAFFSAGKYIVDHSDLLFAIWDGQQAKGLGGTGDIVEYALSLKKKVIHFNTVLGTKITHNI